MNVLETMNSIVAYIEDHLKEEIDYQTVARIACYSEHHTKRMFSFIAIHSRIRSTEALDACWF
ncbi:hypothetical protein [Alkalicoccus luteus]|uniref:hypothetical protein n=1 Tax=Alkalicoccus luteus TaxID=1237094 RepID=UPI00403414CF